MNSDFQVHTTCRINEKITYLENELDLISCDQSSNLQGWFTTIR